MLSQNQKRPPLFPRWLLRQMRIYQENYLIAGDIEEVFHYYVSEKGYSAASLWFWGQALYCLPKYLINCIHWRNIMLKNYIKIAFRNIVKQKGFSFLNISGLTVGMACCILILLWVRDELSFDRFHKNADVIYRVTEHQYNSSGDYFPVAVTPWPLAEELKNNYPEIIESARLRILSGRLINFDDKKFIEDDFVAVDPSFLKMFSFPLIKGDISTALSEPSTVLITQETAKKYFGDEDPLGKSITISNRIDFKITGVLKDVPQNSHLRFDFLVPFESTLRMEGWSEGWGDNNYYTFIQLQNNSSYQTLSEKIYEYILNVFPQSGTKFILQPLTDIHLRSDYAIDLYGQTQSKTIYVYVFSIVALFVLFIACINFMNLSTARSVKRAKEVGLRKVVGAKKSNLVVQFYGESIFLTIISLVVAVFIVYLLLPLFNDLSGKQLTLHLLNEPYLLLGLLGLGLFTGLVSGSYPALVQSSFKPVDSVKGAAQFLSGKSRRSMFRKILVITQFTLSIMLIIGTLIVYRQVNFMMNSELGYEKEHMISLRKRGNLSSQYETFKNELIKNPNIMGVTASSDIPTYTVHSTSGFSWEGRNPEISFLIHQFTVDHDYIKTFNMEIVEGRDFSKEFPVDATTQTFIVNETAVKAMGLEDPIGKRFTLYRHKGHIVGVVKDFHYKSLQTEIEPLCLRIYPQWDNYIFIKVKSESIIETISSIESVYKDFSFDYPFEFSFLDEAVEGLYYSEKKTRQIFNHFTLIAIIISCLGLFGLAAFMTQEKTKEIGVRKILGASLPNIVKLLSKEFIVLVSAANMIAWPVAYFFMKNWLLNFAYRIDLTIDVFLLSGFIALGIAIMTVSYHSIKAATTNPVDSLRYE